MPRTDTDLVYYLGVPEPSWLHHGDGVPKFVSAARFDRYTTGGERWPIASASSYAIDSGAYIALTGTNKTVPWFDDPDVYGGKILRFIDNSGYPPDFAAIQDVPCEPAAQRATGLKVRDHQELTCDSYDWLTREFPMVPWIPVLQGEKPGEHVDHAHMYADRGVDLASCHRVGIGSICRLTELDGLVERIRQLEDLAAQGLRMHGFGIKTDALPLIGHVLASADSMAWSAHVRHNGRLNPIRLPDCTHAGDCRNCYRYAVHWRERVLATLTSEEVTMSMFEPKTGALWAEARNIDTTNYRILRWFVVTAVDGDTVTTVDVDQERWSQDRPDKSSWRLDPPVDVRPGPFKTISRDKLRNKNFVLMADAAQVGAILPTREEITVATTVKAAPAGQGDLMAQLGVLASLVAGATTKKPTPAPKPPRQRTPATKKPARPTPVEIPADKMVTPDMLASLGAGTLFRVGGSSIVTFDRIEDGDQPGTVTVWTTSGWSFRHGVDERRMRVYTPAEAEFERRLSNLEHPGMQRNTLGTVPAGQVADGTFVQATGMLPTGQQATLVGYVVSVMTVVRNYQGWTKNDCCAVTIAERPEHLDGVQIEMSPDGELTVLDTGVPVPGQPLPAGTSAPWTKPTAEQLLADAGLKLTGDAEDGPGTVTWRMPWMGPERTEPAAGAVQTKLLSNGGGPVGNWRWILNQTMVDKAIADGVWPHPLESGPLPLHRVRDSATGWLTGLVDGNEATVHGEYRYFWTRSAGASCSATVYVQMKVTTGPDVMDWKMVTVEVPWTGATFYLGDTTPATESDLTSGPVAAEPEPPMDLLAILAAAVAEQATAQPDATPAAAAGRTLPLSDAPWGAYGKVSAGWGPDGSRGSTLVGYVIKTARIYTGGLMGRSKDKHRVDEELLLCSLEVRADGSSSGVYAPLSATFTVLDSPADHELHATEEFGRRLPFADVRPGDVIYLWDERDDGRTLQHHERSIVADLRTRYHVQDVPVPTGDGQFSVQVLIDGAGPVVAMSLFGQTWVDIVDPHKEPWNAADGERPNPFVAARCELTDRLGTQVLVDQYEVVAVTGSVDGVAAIGEVMGCEYRWWFEDEGRHFFRPADAEQAEIAARLQDLMA